MNKKHLAIFTAAAALMLTSCGTTKKAQNDNVTISQTTSNAQAKQLEYVRKVNDNAVYSKDIVAKMDLRISAMGRDLNVDGKINMRKGEVIRLTISPFGLMEVGRLEFTPDYVLIVNRIDKEYTKAPYSDLDFLKNNGITYYMLESLFWNRLFVPAKNTMVESDLAQFTADMGTDTDRSINLQSGKMDFTWVTDVARALITKAMITYGKGTTQASTMSFDYGDFVPMGSKKFPSKVALSFNSKAVNSGKMTLTVKMGKITNDSNWESKTSISEKYKEVKAEALFAKLVNM